MNPTDILALCVVVALIITGYRRGFVKTLLRFGAVIISLVLATIVSPYVADFMQTSSLYDGVFVHTQSVISAPESESDRLEDYGTAKLDLPRSFTKNMQKSIDENTTEVKEFISGKVANFSVKIVSMLIAFLLIRLILFFLLRLVGKIRKIPVIGFGDGLMGALFGLLQGLLVIYIALTFVALSAMVSPDNVAVQAVNNSEFIKAMYHDNPALEYIYKD